MMNATQKALIAQFKPYAPGIDPGTQCGYWTVCKLMRDYCAENVVQSVKDRIAEMQKGQREWPHEMTARSTYLRSKEKDVYDWFIAWMSGRTSYSDRDATEQDVQEVAHLHTEQDGVKMYAQDLHYNVHYIVVQGLVFERIGYHGQNLFDDLVALKGDDRAAFVAELTPRRV